MADHEFHGTVSAQAGTASDHLMQKAQVDASFASAVNRTNHTGTQATTTIDGLQAYVDGRVQLIVDAAPAALDTLNELAAALGDDPNFSATVTTSLTDLDTRVDTLEAAGGGYTATIGDATLSVFTVTHNLNGKVIAEVVRLTDGQTVYPVVARSSVNALTVDFGTFVPAISSHEVLVRKVA